VTDQSVLTPTVARVVRRSLFWVGAATIALLFAVVGVLLTANAEPGDPLSASNPAPAGGMALAEVLRDRGVTVTEVDSLEAARSVGSDPAGTTLLLFDPDRLLDAEQRGTASTLADTIVVVDPDFDTLEQLAPGIANAGDVDGLVDAGCTLPAAERAGTILADGKGYRITDDDAEAIGCFDSGDDILSLVRSETDLGTVTTIGAIGALSNEFVGEAGNAALALGLLGEQRDLIWYIPGVGDVDSSATAPTLGELSPPWVIAMTSLLALTALTAAFWRGRRLGPLIIENLPVVVRASETMRGRARLYEKNAARLHALDALRIGTVTRLAVACGLPSATHVDGAIAGVAAVTGRPLTAVRALLVDEVPHTDAELVRLSDALLTLERAVADAIRPD